MLRCIVEVVPLGNEIQKYEIERLEIINDATHPRRPEYGNYKYSFRNYTGIIKNHKRDDGAFVLIKNILSQVLPEEEGI